MIAVSEFFPRVQPYVIGCPEPTMAQALVDSAIAFCDSALVIRQRLDRTHTVANVASLELDLPSQQGLSRILALWLDGYPLLGLTGPADDALQLTGRPQRYYTRRNDSQLTLQLYPIPDSVWSLDIEVALRPLRTAKLLERDLLELWSEPVVSGALARLCMMPDTPFTNTALAQLHTGNAYHLSAQARIESQYQRASGPLQVRSRAFA